MCDPVNELVRTLHEHAKGSRFTTTEIVDLGVQLSSALETASNASAVHGGIRPETILIRREQTGAWTPPWRRSGTAGWIVGMVLARRPPDDLGDRRRFDREGLDHRPLDRTDRAAAIQPSLATERPGIIHSPDPSYLVNGEENALGSASEQTIAHKS